MESELVLNYLITATYLNYIFIYILSLLFFFLTLNLIKFKDIKLLSDLSYYKKKSIFFFSFLSIFFSFAGIPPFLGFFPKFFILFSHVNSSNYAGVVYLLWLTFFSGYFYIQTIRFLYQTKSNKYNYKKNTSKNSLLLFILIIFISFTSLGFFSYIEIYQLSAYLTSLFYI